MTDAAVFMIFMVLFWAWFWPEDTGEWAAKIANGYRKGLKA